VSIPRWDDLSLDWRLEAHKRDHYAKGAELATEAERARFRALLTTHVRYAHNVAILPADVIAELLGGEP
jgi:hypothetical protein